MTPYSTGRTLSLLGLSKTLPTGEAAEPVTAFCLFVPNPPFSARSHGGQQRALEEHRGRRALPLSPAPLSQPTSSSATSLLPQSPDLTLSKEGLLQVCPPRVLCPGSTVGLLPGPAGTGFLSVPSASLGS